MPLTGDYWEKWEFGDPASPLGTAYIRRWPNSVEVIYVRAGKSGNAYRAYVENPDIHPFVPELVSWYFGGPLAQTVQRVLALPVPEAGRYGHTFTGYRVPKPWLDAGKRLVREATFMPRP